MLFSRKKYQTLQETGGSSPQIFLLCRKYLVSNTDGFTILEVIVSLVLLSLVFGITGLIVTQGVKAYIFAKENATLSQKIQLASDRIIQEVENLVNINDISETGDAYLCYTLRIDTFSPDVYRCIGYYQNEIRMLTNATLPITNPDFSIGSTLLDNVTEFRLDYYDSDDPNTDTPYSDNGNWPTAPIGNLNELYIIRMDITSSHQSSGEQHIFSTSVNPRRVGRFNGPVQWNK